MFTFSDEYGFERDFEHVPREYQCLGDILNYIINYQNELKWNAWDGRFANFAKENPELKMYVKNGIPSSYRPLFWFRYSGAENLLERYPGYYQK